MKIFRKLNKVKCRVEHLMLTVVARMGLDRRWRIKGSQCVGSNKDGETGGFVFSRRQAAWEQKKRRKKLLYKTRSSNSFGPTAAQSQSSCSVPTYRPNEKIRTEEQSMRWRGAARKLIFLLTGSCHKACCAAKMFVFCKFYTTSGKRVTI